MTPVISVPATDGTTNGSVEQQCFTAVLDTYGWRDASVTHLGTSENVTLRLATPARTAILRIYRIGHRTRRAIEAELAWMDSLREDAGISTPEALLTRDGERIQALQTSHGQTYCVAFRPLAGAEPEESRLTDWFHRLGVLCARMHNHADDWSCAPRINRPRFDHETLIGERAVWGSWDRAPALNPAARPVLEQVSDRIRERLDRYGTHPRAYGLIHGDLRLQNLLVDGNTVHVIDFDDCCFCWRLYDLATALSLIEDLPVAPQLLDTWLEGYRTIRPLHQDDLDMVADLVMMRRLQVLGWLGSRSQSELAREVSPWYVPATVAAADVYLSGKPRLQCGL